MLPELDAIITKQLGDMKPGAAVAVIKDGIPIHVKGCGLANVEWNSPIEPDTVFRLASVTKQFTATAIMLLVEQGKLSVDDPLTKFLPKYPTSGHHITIHHLLTHTSGIHSYTNVPDFIKKSRADVTPQEMVDDFSEIPFDFKPGTRYLYNNSGYVLLGLIIEKVSGMSYADFFEQHIFAPLGMSQSCYLNNEPIIPGRASGYEPTEQGIQNATFLSMTQPYSAGGLGSTVNDLILWDKALRENTLLSVESQARMVTPVRLEDGSTAHYGYGWAMDDYRGYRAVHHGGNIFGFSTFICRFVKEKVTIIILSNLSTFSTTKLTAAIAAHMFGLPEIKRQPFSLPKDSLSKYAGKYAFESGFSFEIMVDESGQISLNLGRPVRILPFSPTEFYDADDVETTFTFSAEQDGLFTRVVFGTPFSAAEAAQRTLAE